MNASLTRSPAPTDVSRAEPSMAPIPEIVDELRAGRMVILVDEEDRENEGDLLMAAEYVTPESINFMVTHARGLVCLTLTEERCQRLNLPLMANRNGARFGTNFTVSIEAAEGVTTGISAADRAHTVRTAVARDARPDDIVQPGHIFPIQAAKGGVLVRAGHTEAGCDLTALAGLTPAAVICEVLKPDGTMARLPDLQQFAAQHGLKIGTIADLIQYRSAHESMIERLAQRQVRTAWGDFQAVAYRDRASGAAHMALVHGQILPEQETLVRVHEPTSVLDVLLTGADPTHSWSVDRALQTMATAPSGVLVLMNCQGSAQRLFDTFAQWNMALQPQGREGARVHEEHHDLRTYGIGVQILRDLGVCKARLLAKPRRMPSMAGFALTITGYDSEPSAPLPPSQEPRP